MTHSFPTCSTSDPASRDLERVEVLKGPHGILFGQNSTGGAINYIAAKPTRELEAGFSASYGRFDTFDGEAYISGPVSDTIAVRLAGSATISGPWPQNYTRDAEMGRQDRLPRRRQGGRGEDGRADLWFSPHG